jgi:hypothetical protein
MKACLAVVPSSQGPSRPDISWIKKNVSVFEVGKALGLRIRHRKTQCWRPENHANGDADPSLHFYERRNRVRCFVCDMRGGHSSIDLVMGVRRIDFPLAVRWIADRFIVPDVRVGRPVGNDPTSVKPYRVGVRGSEWEVIVRSGMWGAMTVAGRSVLLTLDCFKDPDSGLARLSYRAIMRYSGVKKMANVSSAIKELSRMQALQVSRGQRIGVTRECSAYRVTLDNPKFVELCNRLFSDARQKIAQEREYRASQKRERERAARKPNARSLRIVTQNTNTAGGFRPPDPPHIPFSHSNQRGKAVSTCEGQPLSSLREVHANKALPRGKREIGNTFEPYREMTQQEWNARRAFLQAQADEIAKKQEKPA